MGLGPACSLSLAGSCSRGHQEYSSSTPLLQAHQGGPLTLLIKAKSFLLPVPGLSPVCSPPLCHCPSQPSHFLHKCLRGVSSFFPPSLLLLSLSDSGPSQVHLPQPRRPFNAGHMSLLMQPFLTPPASQEAPLLREALVGWSCRLTGL